MAHIGPQIVAFATLLSLWATGAGNAVPEGNSGGGAAEARRLLQRCLEAQSVLERVSMRVTADYSVTSQTDETARRPTRQRYESHFRRDGRRIDVFATRSFVGEGWADKSVQYRIIFNDQGFVSYNFYPKRTRRLSEGMVATKPEVLAAHRDGILSDPYSSGNLEGYFVYTPGKPVAQLLLESAEQLVLGRETVGAEECDVVGGHTPYGSIRLWLSPSHGYNASRIAFDRGPEDLWFQGKPLSEAKLQGTFNGRLQTLTRTVETVDDISFTFIDGHPVASSGQVTSLGIWSAGDQDTSLHTYRRTDVELKPDFKSTDAFRSDLPEGARVLNLDDDSSGIVYVWQGGRAVPAYSNVRTTGIGRWLPQSKAGIATTTALGLLTVLGAVWFIMRQRAALRA